MHPAAARGGIHLEADIYRRDAGVRHRVREGQSNRVAEDGGALRRKDGGVGVRDLVVREVVGAMHEMSKGICVVEVLFYFSFTPDLLVRNYFEMGRHSRGIAVSHRTNSAPVFEGRP